MRDGPVPSVPGPSHQRTLPNAVRAPAGGERLGWADVIVDLNIGLTDTFREQGEALRPRSTSSARVAPSSGTPLLG